VFSEALGKLTAGQSKPIKFARPGKERQDSVYNGFQVRVSGLAAGHISAPIHKWSQESLWQLFFAPTVMTRCLSLVFLQQYESVVAGDLRRCAAGCHPRLGAAAGDGGGRLPLHAGRPAGAPMHSVAPRAPRTLHSRCLKGCCSCTSSRWRRTATPAACWAACRCRQPRYLLVHEDAQA